MKKARSRKTKNKKTENKISAAGKKEEAASKMFWANTYSTKQDFVVAVCDEDIIEKELKFKYHAKKEAIKVKLSKNFYGGMLIDEGIVLKLLNKATIANLMGKRAVGLAEKNGFIIHENIILIDEIPHAQFVKIYKAR